MTLTANDHQDNEIPQDYMRMVFGEGGLISKQFDGYSVRPQQVKFSRAVHDALQSGSHLVAEIPCGVGKSVAYSVPASWHAASTGKRVLICTSNKALQEQLVEKDLPMLAKILPWKFQFSLIKGRANYFCHMNVDKDFDRIKPMQEVMDWLLLKHDGDLTKLASHLLDAGALDRPGAMSLGEINSILGCSSDDCLGSGCKYSEECNANNAKVEALESNIVVANYHLLFAHLKVLQMTGGAVSILPDFDVVIWDEAHAAAGIAREFFGDRITEAGIRRIGLKLPMAEQHALMAASSRLFDLAIDFAKTPANKPRMRKPWPEKMWQPVFDALMASAKTYRHEASEIINDPDDVKKNTLIRFSDRANKMAARVKEFGTIERSDNSVYFVDLELKRGRRPRVALVSKLVDVAPVLNNLLWSKIDASVQTSATLAVGESFKHQLSETGVPEIDSKTLLTDTPFDFANQCALVVPSDLPIPAGDTRDRWETEAVSKIGDIISIVGGRTLCLFTTRKMLDQTAIKLPAILASKGLGHLKILVQGEAALRTRLVEQFRQDETSVLLGTESFWAGVDVPGRSCSCVIIDKFPFPPPTDPVIDAFQERYGRNTFMRYSIPVAVIQFKQGFGRLIRRASDSGLVVFLDKRIKTKPYGRSFLNSIPKVEHASRVTPELVARIIGAPLR